MVQKTKEIAYTKGNVSYEVTGNGNAVVLLHGAGASAKSNWFDTVPLLSKNNKVINIDLIGAGKTTFTGKTLFMDNLIHLVNSIIDEEEIENFNIVGYSTGAITALCYGIQYPEKLDNLVLIAPWYNNDARTKSFFNLWEKLFETDSNLFAHFNTHLALSMDAQLEMSKEAFDSSIQNFENTGFNQDLIHIIRLIQRISVSEAELSNLENRTRTTIIGFEDDRITPFAYATELKEKINGSILIPIKAGHGGPWEATETLNKALMKIINKE